MTVNDVTSVKDYFDIKGFMIRDLKLKGNELLIYALVFSYSEKGAQTGYFGSLETIAQRIGSSKSRVCKVFSDLTARGLLLKSKVVNEHNITCCLYRTNYDYHIDNGGCHIDNGTGVEMTPNIYNNNHNNISSDEDVDSNESTKEQETDSTEGPIVDNKNNIISNMGLTRASDMNNKFITSWLEGDSNDITENTDISDTIKSSREKERKSSARKKERPARKPVNTPASRVYAHYKEVAERLVSDKRIAEVMFADGAKAVASEWGKIKKCILTKMSEEDAVRYIDYVSHDNWVLDNIGFPLGYLLSEKTIIDKMNRMRQENKKSEPYVPPVKRITKAIRYCDKCGGELFADNTCPICNLGV